MLKRAESLKVWNFRWVISGAAAAVLALAGCMTQPPTPPPPPPQPLPQPESAQPSSPQPSPQQSSQQQATQSAPQASSQSHSSSSQQIQAGQPQAPKDASATAKESRAGSTAPARTAATGSNAGAPPGGLTEAERKAALDNRLQGSLKEFDQRLAREQAELQREREAADGGSSASGGAAGGSESGDAADSGQGSKQDVGIAATPDAGSSSQNGGQPIAGRGGGANNLPIPADIPDGHDDDVVARQLREAAMQEKDPELRKRLWDEYREYKKKQS